MPPTRLVRYCCANLKESGGKGHVVVTGVRWAESANRKNNQFLVNIGEKKNRIVYNDDNDDARRSIEQCFRTKRTLVNPIIDWTDDDVWAFIKENNVDYCNLYNKGYKRLGCIGCPMNTNAEDELERYPKILNSYVRAFDRMLVERQRRGLDSKWKTGEEVMDWWMHGGSDSDEITLLDDMEDEDENG